MPPSPSDILRVEGLDVAYGPKKVLHNINLDIQQGELLAVVGPNGAGKSTLVRTLTGKIAESSGAICVAGQIVSGRGERRHLIGLVPQHIALYDHLTGRENLDAFARFAGLARDERHTRINAALKLVGMSDRADHIVADMSGGMQRRINVAAAILKAPPLIIFDEPTAGVDQPARDVIHNLARRLADTGHGVLLVTHELEAVEEACDRLLILKGGQTVGFGTADQILTAHFAQQRDVIVRYRVRPPDGVVQTMRQFGFVPSDTQSVWSMRTQESQGDVFRAFITRLRDQSGMLSEVTVRRPGLPSMMQDLERL